MTFPNGVRFTVTDGYPWLEFFDDENPNPEGAPFVRQDVKPDGTEWESVAEVTAYAQACLYEWSNPSTPEVITLDPAEEARLIAAGWTPPVMEETPVS